MSNSKGKQKPFIVVDPAKCKHGTFPSSTLVPERFRELQEGCNLALETLGARLNEAEDAAARGRGVPEIPGVSSNGNQSHVEQRINQHGYLADEEVRELRKVQGNWLKEFRRLVQDFERDLGQRAPLKGPRDRFGRLRILGDSYYNQDCLQCNRPFSSTRSDAKYCSDACRDRARRERNATPATDDVGG